MLFTSGPLARNQVTSDLFKKKGALASAPCAISETRSGPIPSSVVQTTLMICATFYSYVIALFTSKAIDAKIFSNCFVSSPPGFYRLFPLPLMAVSLSRQNDTARNKLLALGFAEQANGRLKFYTGPSHDSTIRDAIGIDGVIPDAYSPRGFASVHGIMALEIINRALFLAFRIASNLSTITPETFKDLPETFIITETNYTIINASGIFFPYFDGLLLADKSSVSTFITIFSRCLGAGGAAIKDNCETLHSGWSSAANTTAGRAASHAIWCLDNALRSGYDIRPVVLNGEYTGCIMFGKVNFVHHGKVVSASSAEQLQTEVGSFMTHTTALENIAGIINLVASAPVSPDQLTSFRAIHNRIREYTFSPEQMSELRSHLRGLRFNETMWSTSDPSKVALVIQTLMTGSFLPDNAPIYSSPEVMVTKEHIFSTLSVFGPKAISLVSKGTAMTRPWGENVYTGVSQPGTLSGIPVFTYPLQEAYELWKVFLNDHVIKFSHQGKDKMGRIRVKGYSSYIAFESQPAKDIMGAVGAKFRSAGKRKAVEEPENKESGTAESEESRKRRRLKGYGMLFAAPGVPAATEVDGDDDMDANF